MRPVDLASAVAVADPTAPPANIAAASTRTGATGLRIGGRTDVRTAPFLPAACERQRTAVPGRRHGESCAALERARPELPDAREPRGPARPAAEGRRRRRDRSGDRALLGADPQGRVSARTGAVRPDGPVAPPPGAR